MPTIWSFDLGKASIGEAVRDPKDHSFPHLCSLLLPEDFAETKTAAAHRRMLRTRLAHHAREKWLRDVWCAAGLTPLLGRRVALINGEWREIEESPEESNRRKLLEREFPAKTDRSVIYTSCLLRIELLRGHALQEWQIYKALHSALQRRGFGPVPWAEKDEKRTGKTAEQIEKELAKKDPKYADTLRAWEKYTDEQVLDSSFHLPCYYQAFQMGLWKPGPPETMRTWIEFDAGRACRVRFNRVDVERELTELAQQAERQLPALEELFQRVKREGWEHQRTESGCVRRIKVFAGNFAEFFVHGPAGKPADSVADNFSRWLTFRAFGDTPKELRKQDQPNLKPGTDDDWLGALGQKTPRFDNRIVTDCSLFPRLKVCKAEPRRDPKSGQPLPETLLHCEVVFLQKLKYLQVRDGDTQRPLTVGEIKTIHQCAVVRMQAVKPGGKQWEQNIANCFHLKEEDWVKRKGIKQLGLRPMPGHEEVKAPNVGGRSRYCRPALRFMHALILSGQKPSVFLGRLTACETALLAEIGVDLLDSPAVRQDGKATVYLKVARPWILRSDLKFLTDLAAKNDQWEKLYFPEQRLDVIELQATDDQGVLDRGRAIRRVLSEVNDPIVRHRLSVFAERLTVLQERYGVPDQIVLEFVRTDFMGTKAKQRLADFQKKREQARSRAKEAVGKLEIEGRSAALRYMLWEEQGFQCLYTGRMINQDDLQGGKLEMDHIVPQSRGGSDAIVNYVLTFHDINNTKEKGALTAYELKRPAADWHGYLERVKSAPGLNNKKVQLLTREDAPELVQRYTALAETAWISRLAQKIASLHFGWKMGVDTSSDQGRRRIHVVSGGLTARIRRKYRLNELLAPAGASPEEAEKKNRADDRHHALDAMVISFWHGARNEESDKYFQFPAAVNNRIRELFRQRLASVVPQLLCFPKPRLAETIYRREKPHSGPIILRVEVEKLAMKPIGVQKFKYDRDYLRDQIKGVRDPHIRSLLAEFVEMELEEPAWKEFCKQFALRRKDGASASPVKSVAMKVSSSADEYADLSKDHRGGWRKAKQEHKGQIVYFNAEGKPKVRPVYVFESVPAVRAEIKAEGGKFYGFFRSGCLVQIDRAIAHAKTPLEAGVYRLNTLLTDGRAKVTGATGQTSDRISIVKFIEAQLKPIRALETLREMSALRETKAQSRKT
jgi:CRISPR-associated endonuclease Csn1